MANDQQRYIIQFQFLGNKPDLEQLKLQFSDMGIVLDCGYQPVLVNSQRNRYVVRGFASASARENAEKSKGMQCFADSKQKVIAH